MTFFTENPEKHYELLEKIGEGSYGEVFKGLKRDSNEIVAIKVIPLNQPSEAMDVCMKETNVLSDCSHPNIVKYFASYLWESRLWVAMEYCGGGAISDLYEILERPLKEDEIAYVCHETLKGLEYLHSNRKLHRDIKGGNILMTDNGDIKLVDFGVSAQMANTFSKRDTMTGTPYWMAPEIIQGEKYNGKADIWSLGITAIEMAEMLPPLAEIHPMRVLFMIPRAPPPVLEDNRKWSPKFSNFVSKCLTKNPLERPTAEDLLKHRFLVQMTGKESLRRDIEECNRIVYERGYRYCSSSSENEEEEGTASSTSTQDIDHRNIDDENRGSSSWDDFYETESEGSEMEHSPRAWEKAPNASVPENSAAEQDANRVKMSSLVGGKSREINKSGPSFKRPGQKRKKEGSRSLPLKGKIRENTLKSPTSIHGSGSSATSIGKKGSTKGTAYSTLRRKQSELQGQLILRFRMKRQTTFGQHVLITGNLPELGEWKTAQKMTPDSDVGDWSFILSLPATCKFEYKYLLESNSIAVWEEGANRTFRSEGLGGVLEVRDTWQSINILKWGGTFPQISVLDKSLDPVEARLVGLQVNFQVICPAFIKDIGASVYISGNVNRLGKWNLANAPKLLSLHSHLGWYGYVIPLALSEIPVEYKFVIQKIGPTQKDNWIVWEEGPNRVFSLDPFDRTGVTLISKASFTV